MDCVGNLRFLHFRGTKTCILRAEKKLHVSRFLVSKGCFNDQRPTKERIHEHGKLAIAICQNSPDLNIIEHLQKIIVNKKQRQKLMDAKKKNH